MLLIQVASIVFYLTKGKEVQERSRSPRKVKKSMLGQEVKEKSRSQQQKISQERQDQEFPARSRSQ